MFNFIRWFLGFEYTIIEYNTSQLMQKDNIPLHYSMYCSQKIYNEVLANLKHLIRTENMLVEDGMVDLNVSVEKDKLELFLAVVKSYGNAVNIVPMTPNFSEYLFIQKSETKTHNPYGLLRLLKIIK